MILEIANCKHLKWDTQIISHIVLFNYLYTTSKPQKIILLVKLLGHH